MSGRPSWADRLRVVRSVLERRARPFITCGQGQAIRKRTYLVNRSANLVNRSAKGTPVTPGRAAAPAAAGPRRRSAGRLMPQRFQLRRTRGWRKPAGGVSCARPGKWGNPFTVAMAMEFRWARTEAEARQVCVNAFRCWLEGASAWDFAAVRARRERILADIEQLRGRDLGCFCGLDQPCHVDVILERANA